jgi:uncharacterized hydrophobic protein (TIGR00271 family)
MKEVSISIPKDKTNEVGVFLEKEIKMNSIIYLTGVNCDQFIIYLPQSKVRDLLEKLDSIGCGTIYGLIKVSNINAMKPVPRETNNLNFKTSGTLSLEQIYSLITSNIDFDIDHFIYTLISGFIASLGLSTDSVVMVVASMLLSPIMGPLLGFTLGIMIKDKFLIRTSLKTELIDILTIFTISFLIGMIFGNFQDDFDWPTEEMIIRGRPKDIIIGLLLAIPSGMAVGLSVTTGGINNFVGVAVAASLVPVLANSGLLLAHGMMVKVGHYKDTGDNYAKMGGYSFLIFLINVVLISGVGMIVFKLKKIKSFRRTSTMWKFPKITDFINMPEEENKKESEFIDIDTIMPISTDEPIALPWNDEINSVEEQNNKLMDVIIDNPNNDTFIDELKVQIMNSPLLKDKVREDTKHTQYDGDDEDTIEKLQDDKFTRNEIREIIRSNPRIKTILLKAVRSRVIRMREIKKEEEEAEIQLEERLRKLPSRVNSSNQPPLQTQTTSDNTLSKNNSFAKKVSSIIKNKKNN